MTTHSSFNAFDHSFFARAAVILLTLTGCGPRWVAVRQTTPNPFLSQTRFSVLPIDYSNLVISGKPEATYLAGMDAKLQKEFMADKAGINQEFAKELTKQAKKEGIDVTPATGTADAPFVIRPYIPTMAAGNFGGIAAVAMKVQITVPDGSVLDEIAMQPVPANQGLFNGYSGEKLWGWGEVFGDIVTDYLSRRVHP